MTTITLPRAVVEQALEALESLFNWKVDHERGKRCGDAVLALRAALAQQAEPVEPHRWEGDHNIESPFNACMHKHYCMTLKQAEQAEPVAWCSSVEFSDALKYAQSFNGWRRKYPKTDMPLYTAPPQQAEPVEPVAWMESPHGAIRANPLCKIQFPSQLLSWQIPLYTAPPQRKPLKMVDLRALYDRHAAYQEEGPEASGWWDFARAVERALEEKNRGR